MLISGGTKKDAVLTTDTLYYTPIGESELPWGTEEPKLSGHVEVWQCCILQIMNVAWFC